MFCTHFKAQIHMNTKAWDEEGAITATACLKLAKAHQRVGTPAHKALAIQLYSDLGDGIPYLRGHLQVWPIDPATGDPVAVAGVHVPRHFKTRAKARV